MRPISIILGLAAATTACGASVQLSIGGVDPDTAAETLIETELSDQVGLGPLSAECDPITDAEVGSEFDCTGTSADGQVVRFVAVIDREDHIDVNTINVFRPDVLDELERAAERTLADQVGRQVPEGSIDCGEANRIFGPDLTMVCDFHAPDSDDVYDITFTLADLDSGDFSFEVADAPRP
ncbi:MAG: DUF4333 domain-containing protein [Acidimicrobiales bacterium]